MERERERVTYLTIRGTIKRQALLRAIKERKAGRAIIAYNRKSYDRLKKTNNNKMEDI